MSLEELKTEETIEQQLHEAALNSEAETGEIIDVITPDESTLKLLVQLDSGTIFTEVYSIPSKDILPSDHPISYLSAYLDVPPSSILSISGSEVPVSYNAQTDEWSIQITKPTEDLQTPSELKSLTLIESITQSLLTLIPAVISAVIIILLALAFFVRVSVRSPAILLITGSITIVALLAWLNL